MVTSNFSGDGAMAAFLALASAVLGALTMIFWMIVGWRAMRAHERIADSLKRDERA